MNKNLNIIPKKLKKISIMNVICVYIDLPDNVYRRPELRTAQFPLTHLQPTRMSIRRSRNFDEEQITTQNKPQKNIGNSQNFEAIAVINAHDTPQISSRKSKDFDVETDSAPIRPFRHSMRMSNLIETTTITPQPRVRRNQRRKKPNQPLSSSPYELFEIEAKAEDEPAKVSKSSFMGCLNCFKS